MLTVLVYEFLIQLNKQGDVIDGFLQGFIVIVILVIIAIVIVPLIVIEIVVVLLIVIPRRNKNPQTLN